MRLAIRFRLGLDAFTAPRPCPHVNKDFQPCTSVCDSEGWHLFCCPSGGTYIYGHETVASVYHHLLNEVPGAKVRWRPVVPEWPQPGGMSGIPDLGVDGLPGRLTFADIVLSFACTHKGAADKPGLATQHACSAKYSKYPVYDSVTRRRKVPFDLSPLGFERHGRWSVSARKFTGKAAHARAAALGIDFSSEVQRWYAIVACTIQKTNAKVLRGDPSPITVSAPDRWLRALGRFDLPVV